METCFHHGLKNRKVIATFYLTVLTLFHAILSLNLSILFYYHYYYYYYYLILRYLAGFTDRA